jgi:hypothetical protein
MKSIAGLAALLLGALTGPALAGDIYASDLAKAYGISEIRAGVMIDDVELYGAPIYVVPHFDTIKLGNLNTLSVDVLFDTPDVSSFFTKSDLGGFNWLLSPRPTLGVDLNFKHESMIHASLNWHIPVGDTGFFVEPEVGGAIHDGTLTGAVAPYRNLGCRALFYWSINVGYQIDPHWNIIGTEQHASQDGLCGWTENQGLNYDGIRLSYKF